MTRIHKLIVLTLAALVTLGIAAMLLLLVNAPPAPTKSTSSEIGGPFTLVTMNGETVTDRTYRGKWLLVYFGYTHCPDVCPTTLNNIGIALKRLGPDAAKLQPLFITVDPRRDTVQMMAEYLKSFDPHIVGLTGSQAQTDSVAKAYRIYVAPQKAAGDDYLVDHSAFIYVMNPRGEFVSVIAGSMLGDRLAIQLRKLID